MVQSVAVDRPVDTGARAHAAADIPRRSAVNRVD